MFVSVRIKFISFQSASNKLKLVEEFISLISVDHLTIPIRMKQTVVVFLR
jgi:hypothetical protein